MATAEQNTLLTDLEKQVNKMKQTSPAKYTQTKHFINATYDVSSELHTAFNGKHAPDNIDQLQQALVNLRADVHAMSELKRTKGDERIINDEISDIVDGINFDIDEAFENSKTSSPNQKRFREIYSDNPIMVYQPLLMER